MSSEELPLPPSPPEVPPPPEAPPPAPPEPTPIGLTAEDRQWGMFAHLSALLGLLAGGLTFLGPLVVWLMKKDTSRFVDDHGKESLNFQLNVLIYSLILVAISAATCGVGMVATVPLMAVLGVYAIVMPIIAGLKANEGAYYEYPYTFRLIK